MKDFRGYGLEDLVRDAARMKAKRSAASLILAKRGFKRIAQRTFLGLRNEEIVSGVMLDGTRTFLFFNTFLLPAYDNIEFINWDLGSTVVDASGEGEITEEVEAAIKSYRDGIWLVRDSKALTRYIESENIRGAYAQWARFISYVKQQDLAKAVLVLREADFESLKIGGSNQYMSLKEAVLKGNSTTANEVLTEWSRVSAKVIGSQYGEFASL